MMTHICNAGGWNAGNEIFNLYLNKVFANTRSNWLTDLPPGSHSSSPKLLTWHEWDRYSVIHHQSGNIIIKVVCWLTQDEQHPIFENCLLFFQMFKLVIMALWHNSEYLAVTNCSIKHPKSMLMIKCSWLMFLKDWPKNENYKNTFNYMWKA